jgi:hypothetical protein
MTKQVLIEALDYGASSQVMISLSILALKNLASSSAS